MSQKEIDELVPILFNKLEKIYPEIDTSNIASILVKLIPIIEESAHTFSGVDKKQIAIAVLKYMARSGVTKSEHSEFLLKVIDFAAPSMIDAMISISKKKVNIGKPEEPKNNRSCLWTCL
jgi:hypothetical protein